MNIWQAKNEIANTLRAYHLKDEQGRYRFPAVHQRPILLMGPPGIGKTAILRQIARECGVGMVSYSMTHHTRQSAVGLPHIEKKSYGGEQYAVTEYTMSEIVASVYDYMEKTGKQEGILFLDEINCVSETLAPAMLQLLQNKTFGNHRIPEGWILVAAGNPPEYNKSVREFDVATLDRVRTIPIEADCSVWLEYAQQRKVHGAILSYLAMKPNKFYVAENQGEKKEFVTARGWEDLSMLLKSYELLEIPVTEQVVSQYLQKEETAREFTACYLLYRKYDGDYAIPSLLAGKLGEEGRRARIEMAVSAGFEERFTVIQLLMDTLQQWFDRYDLENTRLQALHEALLRLKRNREETPLGLAASKRSSLQVRMDAGLLEESEAEIEKWVMDRLEAWDLLLKQEHLRDREQGFERIREQFAGLVTELRTLTEEVALRLREGILFAEQCFGEGQEMVLLVTDLTRSPEAMKFITENGSPEFLRHSDALAYRSQERKLMEQCRQLLEE